MTLPSVNNDLLIFAVSFAITPYDLDYFNLSLPAKSTKDILPYLFILRPSPVASLTTYIVISE
jgi:hypothetical protein